MKIYDVKQGSIEWLMLRASRPTASEMDNLLTPLFKIKDGEGPKTYLAKKVGEWWQNAPLSEGNAWSMDQGTILEDEVVPWFNLEFGTKIQRVGFVTTDDGLVGCSPDGLLGDDGGVEIKCPEVHTHVKYLLNGKLPTDYTVQVHSSMHVTGRKWWKFISYRRHFPKLILHIERDEEIQDKIAEALNGFLGSFEAAKATIERLNGGPRPFLKPLTPYIAKKDRAPFLSETPS